MPVSASRISHGRPVPGSRRRSDPPGCAVPVRERPFGAGTSRGHSSRAFVGRAAFQPDRLRLAGDRPALDHLTSSVFDSGAWRQGDIHDNSLHCHMKNLQVRVDDDEIEDLNALAEEMRLSRSELAPSALRAGLRRLRMEKALTRYLNLEFTLSRAARYAGVSIREMADLASARGIPFFRYSLEQLGRDRERGTDWLKG